MGESILVRVPASERQHVIEDKLTPCDGVAWWNMGRLPVREIDTIYFQCGDEIIGHAKAHVNTLKGCVDWYCHNAVPYPNGVQHVWAQRQGWAYWEPTGGVLARVREAEEDHEKSERLRERRERADAHQREMLCEVMSDEMMDW